MRQVTLKGEGIVEHPGQAWTVTLPRDHRFPVFPLSRACVLHRIRVDQYHSIRALFELRTSLPLKCSFRFVNLSVSKWASFLSGVNFSSKFQHFFKSYPNEQHLNEQVYLSGLRVSSADYRGLHQRVE